MKFEWIRTTCDSCQGPGLRVLAPKNSDGSVGASEFPSLCPDCYQDGAKRTKLEKKAEEERTGDAK